MRIRSTKPEFWKSARIAKVDWDARLVLKGLESYVADNGVGKDDIELIVTDLFSRDLIREGSRILARVSEAISRLSEVGLVWRYEVEGQKYLYLSFWESIQRIDKPQPGRFPRPDGTLHYKDSEIREYVANGRDKSGALAPGTGEQGNRGTGDQSSSSNKLDQADSDVFDSFWATYPRREGKGQARTALKSALKKTDIDTIIHGAAEYSAWTVREGKERKYIAMPATWLNGERWSDERAADKPDHDPDWALA